MRQLLFKLCNFLFGKQANNSLPRAWVLAFDIVVLLVSYLIAMFLVHYNNLHEGIMFRGWYRIFIVTIVYIVMFLIYRTYVGMIRYSGFDDIRKIFNSCTIALTVLIIAKVVVTQVKPQLVNYILPGYKIILYHYFLTVLFMVLSRFTIRRIYNEFYKDTSTIKQNTIVYGAGEGGVLLMRAFLQDQDAPYRIKAFIDDNPKKTNKNINTIPILPPEKVFNEEYIQKNNIKILILALPSVSGERKKELIELGMSFGLKVKTMPSFMQWVDGEIKTNQIQDIKIEDLLGRDPIVLGKENVKREIDGKVVMITGAAGSIGSEMCRQTLHYNPKMLVMVDQAESPMYDLQFELKNTPEFKSIIDRMVFVIANVKDERRMKEVFEAYHPQLIYHAAAYKHVPFMEENPYEAVFVNVFGTKNIVDMAIEYGVEKFVMISTDKAVNPTNVMGATKRIAEIYTQSRKCKTQFITTRFGNVLGSNGSVVPLFRKQLAQGGPLTVTDKRIIRFFMTIPEACSLVMEAGSIGQNNEIFVFDMGQPVKIYDLAKKMIQLSGQNQIEIKEIGLRPGEKLYEELLATKENTMPTDNPKIMRAQVRNYEAVEVNALIEELAVALTSCDDFAIVRQMKRIVPEFKSNNSIFCQLDQNNE
ncbi:MAG: polysaccharide biosynthesis protein [Bacteroidales bacterium]|nr:polysaccharide biosynthesis protein [Bacteroidales bacterium]